MTSIRAGWLAGGLALVFATAGHAQAPTGDAKRGQDLFKAVGCWQCHGTTGGGGGWQGPRLAPNPIPWGAFINQLRHPRAKMPPYHQAVLSDVDAADAYAYLRSIGPGKSASQIAILNH